MKRFKVILMIIMFCFILSIDKVKATEELPDDGGKISSSQIIQTKTGTGPFDANNDPGNDSSEDNNVVRSFDQVTWTVENTMMLSGNEATNYTGGRIYFEATLPDVFTSETAGWDLDSMNWVENAKKSADGLTLTGYYQMSNENITVPGKQTLIFIAKIEGAANGIEFQPTIKFWLNGNNEDEYQTVIPEKIIISATPRYNVMLSTNSYWNQRVTVDFGLGDEIGRMYGYGIVLQLYNTSASKGLKGLEFPKGDITFDIKLKMERSDLGSGNVEDITQNSDVKLWNYKVNNYSANYGAIANRTMLFSGIAHSKFNYDIPYGSESNEATMEREGNRVYDSGNIEMTQVDNDTIRVRIYNYKFNGMYPTLNAENHRYINPNAKTYTDNIGCFVSDYFQLFVPDNDATTQDSSNYYLTVEDTNFKATSISNQVIQNQQKTSDDKLRTTHVRYRKGSYSQITYMYNKDCNAFISTGWRYGDATASIGDIITVNTSCEIGRTNEENVYEVDKLVKFDGNVFEPISVNGSYYKLVNYNTMKFNQYFVTKQDGTNWISQDEMNKADIEDLSIYNTLEDIPDGYICVGVYYESKEGYLVLPYSTQAREIFTYLKIKNTAKIGETYGFTQTNKYWTEELDRSKYSQLVVNGYDSYPKPVYKSSDLNYIKTEYDENGVQISGTHSGGHVYGNTVLIIGAKQGIEQTPVDSNGIEKINYDLGRNEYIVRYKIEPRIYQDAQNKSQISNITIKVKDTLPVGLKYVAGSSNYGDPDITNNSDGTTTLIWSINNCITDVGIEKLYFEASIDENSPNGTQYTNTAIVYTEDERVGNTPLTKRTSESTIQIVNLSSHRLYKTVETPVIEKNGEIYFTVSYKNNTDEIIPDFQMLDILPYNGDNRGTNYTGEYTLDRLVVTQKDGSDKIISNDSLEILYTNDEGVRSGVTSKDENLGAGWSIANSETIKQKATAYVVKGEVGAQGNVTVDVYLKTNGNKGLDKYVNSATAQVYKETEEMVTSKVASQVVERSIEGIAWEDSNRNGVKDEGEQVLSNVEIKLTDELGQQVTDVNGNKVTSVKTDSNGYYKFENLPKGEYYVQVVVPSEKYELTEKQVGTNNEINSKFNEEEKETDKITGLNSIDLPELTISNVNAGFVKIEGSIEITKVDAKDKSKLIEGATFKVERIDESGNVDSTYNIGEQTTGEDGKILFEGLEVGKYRVTETKAPSGYELLEKSIEVEITGEKRDVKLVAENELKLILPLTGDKNNSIAIVVIGITIIILAIILNKKYNYIHKILNKINI